MRCEDEVEKKKRMARDKRSGPKPWRWRVRNARSVKSRVRKYWSRARWCKHDGNRDAKREREPRPYLKSHRIGHLEDRRANEARSRRMRAYHARRRAGEMAVESTDAAQE